MTKIIPALASQTYLAANPLKTFRTPESLVHVSGPVSIPEGEQAPKLNITEVTGEDSDKRSWLNNLSHNARRPLHASGDDCRLHRVKPSQPFDTRLTGLLWDCLGDLEQFLSDRTDSSSPFPELSVSSPVPPRTGPSVKIPGRWSLPVEAGKIYGLSLAFFQQWKFLCWSF